MNELLVSAEFLVHVAVPGAVARPGVTAGAGERMFVLLLRELNLDNETIRPSQTKGL